MLAIDGGSPVREKGYPLWPDVARLDYARVLETIRSNKLSSLSGTVVSDFESRFAATTGGGRCVAVNSGTAAVHTALAALEVGPGDEVIVPAHTFIGSASPIVMQGATPVFADIDEATFNIDPGSVERLISHRTKAIIAVDLNGHPAAFDRLAPMAEDAGVPLIEDAAQAFGASLDGVPCGSFGVASTWSFWEDKILPTGEGGAVTFRSANHEHRARTFINHGEEPAEESYHNVERMYYHVFLGYNYRMSEVTGAMGQVALDHTDAWVRRRVEIGTYLSAALAEVPACIPVFVAPGAVHTYYKYILRLDMAQLAVPVAQFVAALRAEGVPASRRYITPLHHQPVFRNVLGADVPSLPVSEMLPESLVRLSVSPELTNGELDDTVEAVGKVVAAYKR